MQHYKPEFFQVLCHPYDTLTSKINALHLASNEERVK